MQHQVKLFIPTEGRPTEFISMLNPLILESEDIIPLKHLYVKQHSVTKLLYFGVTEQDPIKYPGSGIHWKLHKKKHGRGKKFIKTLCVWTFNCQSDCSIFALQFSEVNNIVNSTMWANLTPENGLSGTPKGHKISEETKKKISTTQRNRSDEEKAIISKKISDANKGKHLSDSHKQQISNYQKGLRKSDVSIQNLITTIKGRRLYDKVGEKSKYFKEQPNDQSWVPRRL